jgi:tetrapyrrole methylase family protein/MazG family protein
VLDKIREETDEIDAAMAQHAAQAGGPEWSDSAEGPDPTERPRGSARVAEEVGDLLFSVVNLARKVGADPELELRASADRFRKRVEQAADLAAGEGAAFEEIGLQDQEGYYQRAKVTLAQGRDGRIGEAMA